MADVQIVIGAQDNASRVLSSVRTSMAQVEASALALNSALGFIGVAGVAGLLATARGAINAVDAFNDLKDATGASIENISALDDVAARTGTSFETVQSALIKFNAALNKTGDEDGKITAALDAIGLSAKELKSIDPAEALLKTAQALAGFADDGNKARLAQELFGKSLKEVAPFLKDLAEKGALNAKVTTEQAEAAEKFNKELFNLQKNSADTARALSIGLVTAINETITAFRNGSAAGKGFFEIAGGRYTDNVRNFYGVATESAYSYQKRLTEIDAQLKSGDTRLLVRGALLREQADVQKKLVAAQANAVGGGRGVVNPELVRPSVNIPDAKTKGPKGPDPDADFKRFFDNLQKQIEKTQELSASEQLLADIQKGRLSVSPAQEAKLKALATELDLINQTAKATEERMKIGRGLATEEGDAVIKANQAYQDRLKTLLDATPTAILEKQREAVQLLTDEYTAGRVSEELYLEAVTARLNLVAEKTKDAKTFAEELGLTFSSAFENAIVDGKKFSDVLDGIGKDIARIIVRKQVTEPLANGIGELGKSGGDFFSNLFSGFKFAGGGTTGNGPRTGGLDGQGGFMAMLHPQETVIDHARGQSVGGGVTIVQNINIDSRSDQASILSAMRQATDMAKSEILRSRQQGGAFA